jgi:hypothetical protein
LFPLKSFQTVPEPGYESELVASRYVTKLDVTMLFVLGLLFILGFSLIVTDIETLADADTESIILTVNV